MIPGHNTHMSEALEEAVEAPLALGPLELKKTANYVTHASFVADTRDHRDHSFNGVMFDIVVKDMLPVESLDITSIAVRGTLGPMKIFVTQGTHDRKLDKPD